MMMQFEATWPIEIDTLPFESLRAEAIADLPALAATAGALVAIDRAVWAIDEVDSSPTGLALRAIMPAVPSTRAPAHLEALNHRGRPPLLEIAARWGVTSKSISTMLTALNLTPAESRVCMQLKHGGLWVHDRGILRPVPGVA